MIVQVCLIYEMLMTRKKLRLANLPTIITLSLGLVMVLVIAATIGMMVNDSHHPLVVQQAFAFAGTDTRCGFSCTSSSSSSDWQPVVSHPVYD
jgi:hypothetical protein